MSIDLDKPHTPSVKLTAIKQYVVGYVLHVAVVPWIEYGTQRVKLAPDGTPRTQEILTLRVVKCTGVKGDNEPVEPDEEVSVWLAGHRRWSWGEAKKQAKGLKVGDKVKIVYSRDEQGKGTSPKKVWDIEIKRGSDPQITAECEARYHEIAAARPAQTAAQNAQRQAPSVDADSSTDSDEAAYDGPF